jgi:hypothetical protein
MNETDFQWKCEPKAEQLILKILEDSLNRSQKLANLNNDLEKHTSTRLFDWLDYVSITKSEEIEEELAVAGFMIQAANSSYRVFYHPRAKLPRVVVKDESSVKIIEIGLMVESIADFLMVRGLSSQIEGSPFSGFRRALVFLENEVCLLVIERRGNLMMEPMYLYPEYTEKYINAEEKWKTRPRGMHDEDDEMKQTMMLTEELISLVGKDVAAWIVLDVERKYWQAKNMAGQLQKNRQDRLGMGWANHDHHTFRSSRKRFSQLVKLFEILGFHCRERYYAGMEAGWGAQVMENSVANLVLFLDVDLEAHEIEVDFAHQPLPEINTLGTIGLWTALHGDSILKAGMHHLEAQFLFEELTSDLHHLGVGMMQPFSSFPFLKQAFTAGEIWHVDPVKVQKLYSEGKISVEMRDKFLIHGAIGSHMENLQRREGYKGFNQKNVSVIIKKTDPRKM